MMGSRFRNGNVAYFDANPGRVHVNNDNPNYANPNARVRPEVSTSKGVEKLLLC